jgi:predicted component of type VI protein secretion system
MSFLLQFSTGESVIVHGTGLIGRQPASQPGEYFDMSVAVRDEGRSLSKTHLEFGEDAEAFWISDRYSANGTMIVRLDGAVVRCDPGKRYRVVSGETVLIADQFFLVTSSSS